MIGPRDVFERMRHNWLRSDPRGFADLLADDAVIELPFAAARFESRAAFVAFAQPRQAGFPVRFEDVRNVLIHDTADPEVIVVEYELVGRHTGTGHTASAPFIGVLRVHDGQITGWREYQDSAAIAAALAAPAGQGR
ncbi:MAG TPA: nuclear transport factor 2 family protein [Pseudonocardiaceae bacterium]|jgi:hypothetical protein|nr:nuclear transport factor 2 family protein [Pseudonocardiaceae bacterium]